MAVDYNIVVLGDGAAARYAAIQARQHQVRVALVLPLAELHDGGVRSGFRSSSQGHNVLAVLRHFNYARYVYQHGPYNLGSMLFQHQAIAPTPIPPGTVAWTELVRSLSLLPSASDHQASIATLEQLGIDVIHGNGQFVAAPQLGFQVGGGTPGARPQRLLQAKSYLIAMDGQAIIPAIAGIASIPYHTLDTFFQPETFVTQPQSVLIISDQIEGIEVASILANLGTQVTLVMPTPQLLPLADADINQWVRSSLAASGVKTHLGATINRVYAQAQGCVAELEPQPPLPHPMADRGEPSLQPTPILVEADELLVIMGRQVDFTTLNLRAIAVDYTPQGIPVDAHYRSSHRRLFAIGDAIEHSGTIAQAHHYQAEAAIALRHALFQGPLLQGLKASLSLPPLAAPSVLPVMVNTHPPAAWIGWTEAAAYERYGDRLRILDQPWQPLPQAQAFSAYVPHATAGFCKLIVLDNGQIVGVQIVGIQAEELINLMAIAMHQSIPMDDLSQLYPPIPSFTADVLRGLVEQWERDRPQRHPHLSDWLELAFNWQRDWTRP